MQGVMAWCTNGSEVKGHTSPSLQESENFSRATSGYSTTSSVSFKRPPPVKLASAGQATAEVRDTKKCNCGGFHWACRMAD
mmetsp:Transcript_68910/g.121804  ORF Transcript_68910/g.121804 Transcript_68910/m.121804 type:complete len:81 (+) Transcript_68910:111-353(+)